MKKLAQNPKLRKAGLVLLVVGGTLLATALYQRWIFGMLSANLLVLVGNLLRSMGSDTELLQGGIKLGFTSLQFEDLEGIYDNGEAEMVLVSERHRRYRIKRWHYKDSEWPTIRTHLLGSKLAEAEQGGGADAEPAV